MLLQRPVLASRCKTSRVTRTISVDERLPLGCGNGAGRAEDVGRPGFVLVAPGADRGVAADGPLGSAGGFDFLQQRGLIVLQLDDEASLHLCGGLRRFFLAMHGIKGNDAVRDIEFAEQLLRGGDFVGLFLDIDVCQDETGFDVEGVQHLGRLAIGEIVGSR